MRTLVARLLPFLPRRLVGRVARRYVAGTTRGEVVDLACRLSEQGVDSTLDLLGENVESAAQAREIVDEYLALLDDVQRAGGTAQISVKPTHVGLRLGEDVAHEALATLVARAESLGSLVQIDMEDSGVTDATIRLFRSLRETSSSVGLAIQAYLRRSLDDVESLLPLRPNLRICKGIYREPEAIALQDRQEIRDSFLALVERIVAGGGYPAIATHDPWLVDRCLDRLHRPGGESPPPHEFQMLLGVGRELRPAIRQAGSRLRIYCPYGEAWYDYSLRRLRENPKIVGYVMKDVARAIWRPSSRGPGSESGDAGGVPQTG